MPPLTPPFKKGAWKNTLLFSFQSLGVIYGRMSIAPIYVFGTIRPQDITSPDEVYQLFSFLFWTLTIISLLKYATIVLRANDDGEGGPFAMYSLLCRHAKVSLFPSDRTSDDDLNGCEEEAPPAIRKESKARRALKRHRGSHFVMLFLALFGACMIIGDGLITPAISVLSASEGVKRSLTDIAKRYVSSDAKQSFIIKHLKYVPVPFACAILMCLFMLQHYGTHKIGFIFAPIVIVWLVFIGSVGLYNIVKWDHQIIYAISPLYMYRFIRKTDVTCWRALSSILLSSAGSEAMFADLGHFSTNSVKKTFSFLVYPILLLSYAGQAAFIAKNIGLSDSFNHLGESVPGPIFRHIFIFWSLIVSVVGSQATITATFSIINQCVALGCFPRVKVIHTSDRINGQVYIPDVNWVLMILSLTAVIGFHDIKQIANATSLAIIGGMMVTTCLMSLVIALYWEKRMGIAACFLIFFGSVEAMYLSACLMNFHKGAWYLVALFVCFSTIMGAWHYGTRKKYEFDVENKVSMQWLTDLSHGLGVSRVPGIGFICTDVISGLPAFFSHFITNLPAFHQVLIFVSFTSMPIPNVPPTQRYLIGRVGPKEYRIYRCIVRHGYCDQVRNTGDFEDQIISSIGEFISIEENDLESVCPPDGRMMIIGNSMLGGNALVPVTDHEGTTSQTESVGETALCAAATTSILPTKGKKKVKFALPPHSPKMRVSVRKELQELIDARDSGTAYFMGQSHVRVRNGSNFLKKILVRIYVFLNRNCRERPVAVSIPYAALVEVGMVYTV
uniref:Potassium transporter n=1 Tax=Kalanchoe fedtschenkoi TaxID=63787 RepID=A0A7N0V8Y5_KALFE